MLEMKPSHENAIHIIDPLWEQSIGHPKGDSNAQFCGLVTPYGGRDLG